MIDRRGHRLRGSFIHDLQEHGEATVPPLGYAPGEERLRDECWEPDADAHWMAGFLYGCVAMTLVFVSIWTFSG